MRNKRALVWFQKDLRIHDNEVLVEASRHAEEVIPVYVFDDRDFKTKTEILKTDKTGIIRSVFIAESVENLRANLLKRGSQLVVRSGISEEVLFQLAKEFDIDAVYCNRERTRDEVFRQESLEKLLWSIGREVRYSRGKMLYYTSDLPFPITHAPDNFIQFRKEVERIIPVRLPLEEVEIPSFKPKINFDFGEVPEFWGDYNFELKGGEDEAIKSLKQLTHLIVEDKQKFKELKPILEMLFVYLADGCLSPKQLYHKSEKWRLRGGDPALSDYVKTILLWRDFYRLMGKKYGELIFEQGGVKQKPNDEASIDTTLFNIWKDGRTGFPYIDACMRKLAAKGYLQNHEKKIVASFLIHAMNLDWRLGAEYFESIFINYDPCSVWGMWNYIAGISSDEKDGIELNCLREAQKYDPNGDLVRKWIPALKDMPKKYIHKPFQLSEDGLKEFNIVLGADYPAPIHTVNKIVY